LKGCDCLVYGEIVQEDTGPSSLVIQPVNLTNPGTAAYNRVGRKIFMRSARIKLCLQISFYNASSETSLQRSEVVRFALVYDRQPSGVLPQFGDIFIDTDFEGNTQMDLNSSLNYKNTSRFSVLRDLYVTVDPPFMPALDAAPIMLERFVDEYVDLQELETIYSKESAECTIADISTGALYFIRACTVNGGTLATANIRFGSIRLRFTD